jgi:hypothetical protein
VGATAPRAIRASSTLSDPSLKVINKAMLKTEMERAFLRPNFRNLVLALEDGLSKQISVRISLG